MVIACEWEKSTADHESNRIEPGEGKRERDKQREKENEIRWA